MHLLAFSVGCHIIYLQNFSSTWPLISLTSPTFILSCLGVVVDHFMWFTYFARQAQKARQQSRNRFYTGQPADAVQYSFWETTSFFATCIWLIPLFLFLSLSANDNALPISSPSKSMANFPKLTLFDDHSLFVDNTSSQSHIRENRTSLFKKIFTFLPEALVPKKLIPKSTPLPLLSPSISKSQSRTEFFSQEPSTSASQSRSFSSDLSHVTKNLDYPLPRVTPRRRSGKFAPDVSETVDPRESQGFSAMTQT